MKRLLVVFMLCIPLYLSFQSPTLTHASDFIIVTNLNNDGVGSLREALAQVRSGGTILIELSGTIFLNQSLLIDKDVTIIAADSADLTLSGQNTTRIFYISGNVDVRLQNLQIANGGGVSSGGGIYNEHGHLTIIGCVFNANQAYGLDGSSTNSPSEGQGGAIYNHYGAVTIEDSTFSMNMAFGGKGASNSFLGIHGKNGQGGALYSDFGSVLIRNSTFEGNNAQGGAGSDTIGGNAGEGQGGALFVNGYSITVEHSQFLSNQAMSNHGGDGGQGNGLPQHGRGAALYLSNQINSTTSFFALLKAVHFEGNRVFGLALDDDYGMGGAVYATGNGVFNFTDATTFTNNQAGSHGGAIYLENTIEAQLSNGVQLSGNRSTVGGGGGIYFGNAVQLFIEQTTFLSNQAAFGGAIASESGNNRHLQITLSVFDQNTAVYGGAISLNENMEFELSYNDFTDNTASFDGGALYLRQQTNLFCLEYNIFLRNEANRDGGALFHQDGPLKIVGGRFVENTAVVRGGAAITQNGTLSIAATIFDTNEAAEGGGLFAESSSIEILNNEFLGNASSAIRADSVVLNITQSRFDANTATAIYVTSDSMASISMIRHTTLINNQGTSGGAIFYNGELTLVDTTIQDNHATNDGGGIFSTNGLLYVFSSAILGNHADNHGGGVWSNGAITVINSTLMQNTAQESGGGIYLFGATNGKYIASSTITANVADSDLSGVGSGGGIFSGLGQIEIKMSIVGGNLKGASTTGTGVDCSINSPTTAYNIWGIGTGCPSGGTNQTIDPSLMNTALLDDFGHHGGSTPTYTILPTSMAYNQIPLSSCTWSHSILPDPLPISPHTDQRGASRDSLCDIGAFELDAALASFSVNITFLTFTETETAIVELQVNNPTATAIQLALNFRGTALFEADYRIQGLTVMQTLDFPSGSHTQTFQIIPIQDWQIEVDETILMDVVASGPVADSATVTKILTLQNTDIAQVMVNPTQLLMTEGGEVVQYTIQLSAVPSLGEVVDVAIIPDSQVVIETIGYDDVDEPVDNLTNAVRFTAYNWDAVYRITLVTVDDTILEIPPNNVSSISHNTTSQGGSGYFQNLTDINLTITILDNDAGNDVHLPTVIDVTWKCDRVIIYYMARGGVEAQYGYLFSIYRAIPGDAGDLVAQTIFPALAVNESYQVSLDFDRIYEAGTLFYLTVQGQPTRLQLQPQQCQP